MLSPDPEEADSFFLECLFNWIDSFPFLVTGLGAFNLWSSLTGVTSGFAGVLTKFLCWFLADHMKLSYFSR